MNEQYIDKNLNVQNNIPINDNGYIPTSEELNLINTQQMRMSGLSSSKYYDSRYHNPINLPQLYLQEDDYNRIYENVVAKVLRIK